MYLLSSESPRQRSSSIFLVIIRVTSCKSSFSLSRFELAAFAVRVSWYSRAVLLINVSTRKHTVRTKLRFYPSVTEEHDAPKPTNAYGLRTVSTFAPYEF